MTHRLAKVVEVEIQLRDEGMDIGRLPGPATTIDRPGFALKSAANLSTNVRSRTSVRLFRDRNGPHAEGYGYLCGRYFDGAWRHSEPMIGAGAGERGSDSTTYRRFISTRSPSSRRPAAKSREYFSAIGSPPPNKSASSETIIFAVRSSIARRKYPGCPCTMPATGSYSNHWALGMAFFSRARIAAKLGDLDTSLKTQISRPSPLEHVPGPAGESSQLEASRVPSALRRITPRLRSGSYNSSTLAWAIASAGAAIERMVRVAFDLHGPAVVTGDQKPLGDAARFP